MILFCSLIVALDPSAECELPSCATRDHHPQIYDQSTKVADEVVETVKLLQTINSCLQADCVTLGRRTTSHPKLATAEPAAITSSSPILVTTILYSS